MRIPDEPRISQVVKNVQDPGHIAGVTGHSWAGLSTPWGIKRCENHGFNLTPGCQNPVKTRYNISIIALLRCLFRERSSPFCTSGVTSAVRTTRRGFTTEHKVDGTPPTGRLIPSFLTKSVIPVTYGEVSTRHDSHNDRMAGRVTTMRRGVYHRGFYRGLPVFYPIFHPFFLGEKLQLCAEWSSIVHTLGGWEDLLPALIVINHGLEPRASSASTEHTV